ncbi:hypothetical protein [Flavobacterium sp. GT3R68]|uniref:hypothetical protein n=1 Tax=Flavobacterium sp. GT3R68 TaxID=2594437 RepID=UPI000F891C70|nr:hypothetical protein [Flavobacterium sp. GT3R68]RTY89351.1 hypothetical protein EKL32_23115 [Flavobacterium sp. GSN2]TRW93911.1 hypothetical protein FNW07_03090 [Flavobacterium sp. GT3R68]
MKIKIIGIIACFLFFTSIVHSQESLGKKELDSVIRVCVKKIDKEETVENMRWSANMMERVTKINNCWTSNYYLCYFYLLVAMESKTSEEKDVYCNSFFKIYSIAENFAKTNQEKSELLTLKAFLKIDVLISDPIKHGKDLSGEILQLFNEAMVLYPKNPRAIYLNAVFKSGMANFFNTKDNYCNSFLLANKIFVKDFVEKDTYLMPLWGAEHNSSLLIKCYGSDDKNAQKEAPAK